MPELIYFLVGKESKDPYECDGIPDKKKQKFMRELKVIDLLIDILIYPFEGENPLYDMS